MKKSVFTCLTVILAGCSAQNTPDFILKHTDHEAYRQKMFAKECVTYQQNRVIQVDGVRGYYDYTSNNGGACSQNRQQTLQPHKKPNRFGNYRTDIAPLTH